MLHSPRAVLFPVATVPIVMGPLISPVLAYTVSLRVGFTLVRVGARCGRAVMLSHGDLDGGAGVHRRRRGRGRSRGE
ncbi:hypothetical protein GCM10007061_14960 [Kocuria marina]|nr:hypothetical protein GCM10007061_14960 [Kocuria marina]